jgi:hypothetical protein
MQNILVFIFLVLALSSQTAHSQTANMIICGNSSKNTLVVRTKKCKSNETRLSLSSFQGSKGDKGDTGAAGQRGESAFDKIPSGKTVTGGSWFRW